MNRTEIEKEVIQATEKVLSPCGGEKTSVSLGDNFRDDLGGDSLDMVQVVMELEHSLDINITDEECDCLTTAETKVSDIADLVEKCLSAKNG